ncbi:RloB domain-containing protein [Candidatus Pacearchaeota archaeon]|nr:RloB domain-containing protein [Candidatus Pacearchaeota archaeon]
MVRDFSEHHKMKPELIEIKRSSESLESINEIFKQEKIFVYGEGQDEKRYFDNLDKDINSSRVKIIPKDCGGSDCYTICKHAKAEFKEEVEKNDDLKDCEKYVVFDCDDNFTRSDLKTGKIKSELAKEFCFYEDFEIILSNMCFEIWILCHYNNPQEVYSKLELLDRDFLKKTCNALTCGSRYRYKILKPLESIAIKNSKKLIELQKSLGVEIYSENSNPVTQIGELVEKLRKYDR